MVAETVLPAAGEVILIAGALLSTVTATLVEVAVWPTASRATAVKVCEPLVAVVVSQATENGATRSSPPNGAPSTKNLTPATAMLSEAAAATVTERERSDPVAGDVMAT